ncbi:3'-5' exonuclease, partial [Neisseria sp. P0003.S003]
LEHSLKEKTSEEWDNHCRALMNPKMLPTQLSDSLAAKLYSLPDTVGVLVWFDHSGKVQSVEAYEKTYSEIAALLHSK